VASSAPHLTLVKPSADPNMNILLYGPPKVGKTIGAASAPKPLLYLNADKPNATRLAHEMYEFDEARVTGLETLMAAIREVDKGEYRTVVLDPLGEVYRILLEEVSDRAMHPKIQHYGDAGTHLERFIRALLEKPVNVVLVAHEMLSKDEETGTHEWLPYTGTNNPALAAKLMALVDVIGYVGVVKEEGGGVKHVAQLINGRGRRGGTRWPILGHDRELDLAEWEATIRNADLKKPQNDTKGAAA